MATKGTTWLLRRSRDLVPALAALAAKEWLTADRDPRVIGVPSLSLDASDLRAADHDPVG